MKKILVSLSIIGAVAALVIGATTAYFSDTETSTGNTLTAGTLDLWLDMVKDGTIEKYNGQNMQIFNVSDIKPGDRGEKTISTHVDNDAWVCVYGNYVDNENGCNEPESSVDTNCDNPGPDLGELDENMDLLIWFDEGNQQGWQCKDKPACDADRDEGDNQYDEFPGTGREYKLYEGKLKDWPANFPNTRFDAKASDVTYIGVAWSVPTTVGNIIQSDGVVANVQFYAVQQKNNPDFTCPQSLP